jgi:hypothetical protein
MNRTVDITPTWSGLVTLLVYVIENSETKEGRDNALAELRRMAEAADQWNAHCREMSEGVTK